MAIAKSQVADIYIQAISKLPRHSPYPMTLIQIADRRITENKNVNILYGVGTVAMAINVNMPILKTSKTIKHLIQIIRINAVTPHPENRISRKKIEDLFFISHLLQDPLTQETLTPKKDLCTGVRQTRMDLTLHGALQTKGWTRAPLNHSDTSLQDITTTIQMPANAWHRSNILLRSSQEGPMPASHSTAT